MLEQTQLQSRWRVNNLHVSFSRCHCACALDIRKGYDAITGSYDKLRHVVYEFKCDLCDADYVGYTRRHLFQRIVEHKHSAIGKHLRDSHNQENKDLTEQFTILKKCRGKFECLIYEMLFIQEKKPKLNTQSDSIKAKLFST